MTTKDEVLKQEPVALVIDGVLVKSELPEKYTGHLYTSQQRQARSADTWVGLTDEQITVLNFMLGADDMDGVWFGEQHPKEEGAFWWRNRLRNAFQDAAIEAKLREKNT